MWSNKQALASARCHHIAYAFVYLCIDKSTMCKFDLYNEYLNIYKLCIRMAFSATFRLVVSILLGFHLGEQHSRSISLSPSLSAFTWKRAFELGNSSFGCARLFVPSNAKRLICWIFDAFIFDYRLWVFSATDRLNVHWHCSAANVYRHRYDCV